MLDIIESNDSNEIEFEYRQYDDQKIISKEDLEKKLRACKDEPDYIAQSKDGSIAYVQHNGLPVIKNDMPKKQEDRVFGEKLDLTLLSGFTEEEIKEILIETYANLQTIVASTDNGNKPIGAVCGTSLLIGDTYYGGVVGDINHFVGIFDEYGNCQSFERLNKKLHNLDVNPDGEIDNQEEYARVMRDKKADEPGIKKDRHGHYRLVRPNKKPGSLAVTRALGNEAYEEYKDAGLSHIPEVFTKKLNIPKGGFAIFTPNCDGLIEHDKNFQQFKAKLIENAKKQPIEIARALNEFAFSGYEKEGVIEQSFDNLSNVVFKKFRSESENENQIEPAAVHVSIFDGHFGAEVAEKSRQSISPELQKVILAKWAKKHPELFGLLKELNAECDKLAVNANFGDEKLFANIDNKLQEIDKALDVLLSESKNLTLKDKPAYLNSLSYIFKQIRLKAGSPKAIFGKNVDIFCDGIPSPDRRGKFTKAKFMIWQLSQDESVRHFFEHCQRLSAKSEVSEEAIQILTDKIAALKEIKDLKQSAAFNNKESNKKRLECYKLLKSLTVSEQAELSNELGIDAKVLTKWFGFSTENYPVTFDNLRQRYEARLEQEKNYKDFWSYGRKAGISLLVGTVLAISVIVPVIAVIYAVYCGIQMGSSWQKHEQALALEAEINDKIDLQLKTPVLERQRVLSKNDKGKELAHQFVLNITPKKRLSQSEDELSVGSDEGRIKRLETNVQKEAQILQESKKDFSNGANDNLLLYPR